MENSELSLVPSRMHLQAQKQILQKRANARISNVFAAKRSLKTDALSGTGAATAAATPEGTPLPDYMNRFRTKNTLPASFRDMDTLPDRLAVADDRTPATKVVNQSYERQKKIEQKRATENAIQKVASIGAANGPEKAGQEEQKGDIANGKESNDKAGLEGPDQTKVGNDIEESKSAVGVDQQQQKDSKDG